MGTYQRIIKPQLDLRRPITAKHYDDIRRQITETGSMRVTDYHLELDYKGIIVPEPGKIRVLEGYIDFEGLDSDYIGRITQIALPKSNLKQLGIATASLASAVAPGGFLMMLAGAVALHCRRHAFHVAFGHKRQIEVINRSGDAYMLRAGVEKRFDVESTDFPEFSDSLDRLVL